MSVEYRDVEVEERTVPDFKRQSIAGVKLRAKVKRDFLDPSKRNASPWLWLQWACVAFRADDADRVRDCLVGLARSLAHEAEATLVDPTVVSQEPVADRVLQHAQSWPLATTKTSRLAEVAALMVAGLQTDEARRSALVEAAAHALVMASRPTKEWR